MLEHYHQKRSDTENVQKKNIQQNLSTIILQFYQRSHKFFFHDYNPLPPYQSNEYQIKVIDRFDTTRTNTIVIAERKEEKK